MGDRVTKIVVVALLVVLGVYLAQPYVDRLLFSASTSRTVEPRGSARRHRTHVDRTSSSALRRPWCRSSARAPARSRLRNPRARTARPSRAPASSGTRPVTSSPTITWSRAPAASPCAWQPVRCCGRSIVGTAPNYDLAVIRVDNTRSLPPPIAIGTSDDLKVGQWVFAIGNPFGLDQTLDHRHHQRAQAPPAHQRRTRDHQRDPDRCCHQSRQFRRSAARLRGTRDRRQHRDPVAVRDQCRDRLCHPHRFRQSRRSRAHPPRLGADAGHRHRRRQRGDGDAGRRPRRGDSSGRSRARPPNAPACAAWTPTPAS